MQLGPHPRTRPKGEQPNTFPTATQRQYEQSCATVFKNAYGPEHPSPSTRASVKSGNSITGKVTGTSTAPGLNALRFAMHGGHGTGEVLFAAKAHLLNPQRRIAVRQITANASIATPGVPGLYFETWDSTNPSRPRITAGKRLQNAPIFAPKTAKCRTKSTRFEPLFNVLVQPQTDNSAKYLRPRIYFSPENRFLPHSIGFQPGKNPSIVGL